MRTTIFAIVGVVLVVLIVVLNQAPLPAQLQFLQVGHWVHHDASQAAFHVNGATGQVDARVNVPGAEPGSQIVQGDKSGYVVGRSKIEEFSKSTLTVENSLPSPAAERPAVLEVSGGPYLVYRTAGRIVRLGDPVATVGAGGPLSAPVAISDGTVWLSRVDSGSVCALGRADARLSCPATLPHGHTGLLSVADDKPVLVDTTAGTLQTVGPGGLGEPVDIGLSLPPSAQVASLASDGRLAVVDPDRHRLHLIDTAGLTENRPAAPPISVELPPGRFAGPVTKSRVVTLLDEEHGEVRTYGSDGKLTGTTKLPEHKHSVRLVPGEDDRVYVDTSDGSHVLVVDGKDGTSKDVSIDDAAVNNTVRAATDTPQQNNQPQQRPDGSTATPATPGAPRNVKAIAGDRSATVTWSAAAANGAPVTSYHVTWPGGSLEVPASKSSTTVGGLTNGKSYVITVVAENAAGRGAGASSAAVVPGATAAPPSTGKQQPQVPAPPPAGRPTVKIVRVQGSANNVVATVQANNNGAAASCTATSYNVQYGYAASCNGTTRISMNMVWNYGLSAQISVTISNEFGQGTDTWTGVPEPA